MLEGRLLILEDIRKIFDRQMFGLGNNLYRGTGADFANIFKVKSVCRVRQNAYYFYLMNDESKGDDHLKTYWCSGFGSRHKKSSTIVLVQNDFPTALSHDKAFERLIRRRLINSKDFKT